MVVRLLVVWQSSRFFVHSVLLVAIFYLSFATANPCVAFRLCDRRCLEVLLRGNVQAGTKGYMSPIQLAMRFLANDIHLLDRITFEYNREILGLNVLFQHCADLKRLQQKDDLFLQIGEFSDQLAADWNGFVVHKMQICLGRLTEMIKLGAFSRYSHLVDGFCAALEMPYECTWPYLEAIISRISLSDCVSVCPTTSALPTHLVAANC